MQAHEIWHFDPQYKNLFSLKNKTGSYLKESVKMLKKQQVNLTTKMYLSVSNFKINFIFDCLYWFQYISFTFPVTVRVLF